MKTLLILLSFMAIVATSLVAKDVTISDNIIKFNQMKEENYMKKLIRERELLMSQRDTRDYVREYKNAKTYCYLDSQNIYACK